MTFDTIRYDLAEDIAVITLHRPEVMNAMNTQMFVDLRNALHELAFDDGLRVLIITGAGAALLEQMRRAANAEENRQKQAEELATLEAY